MIQSQRESKRKQKVFSCVVPCKAETKHSMSPNIIIAVIAVLQGSVRKCSGLDKSEDAPVSLGRPARRGTGEKVKEPPRSPGRSRVTPKPLTSLATCGRKEGSRRTFPGRWCNKKETFDRSSGATPQKLGNLRRRESCLQGGAGRVARTWGRGSLQAAREPRPFTKGEGTLPMQSFSRNMPIGQKARVPEI